MRQKLFTGWIRVNTMDKNDNLRWKGRAILQIGNNTVTSPTSSPRNCSSQEPCRILNCPFTQYGSGLDSICLTMRNMTTDSAHLDKELLADTAHVAIKRSLSLTMVEPTDERAGYESINYMSMHYPSLDKPILYIPKTARETLPCSNLVQKTPPVMGEKCYNNIVAQFDDIIEFLVVNHDSDQHPIHLHGSYFHVIEQGLSQLNETTGLSIADNPNVACNDEDVNCECVNCTTNTRLVKDTMLVPSHR
jgi:FtsP/CotA-like multicopper oxidase with cupredoxin domain